MICFDHEFSYCGYLGLWKLFLVKKIGKDFEVQGNHLDFEGKYLPVKECKLERPCPQCGWSCATDILHTTGNLAWVKKIQCKECRNDDVQCNFTHSLVTDVTT